MQKRILSILMVCILMLGMLTVSQASPSTEGLPNKAAGTAENAFESRDPFAQMTDEFVEEAQTRQREIIKREEAQPEMQPSRRDTPIQADATGGFSRYIVQYKKEMPQAAQLFKSKITGRQFKAQAIENIPSRQTELSRLVQKMPGNIDVIVLNEPVPPSVFASELRTAGAGQYISYIQPDYTLSMSSLSLELGGQSGGATEDSNNPGSQGGQNNNDAPIGQPGYNNPSNTMEEETGTKEPPETAEVQSPSGEEPGILPEIQTPSGEEPGIQSEPATPPTSILVAVLDTGFDPNHPMIAGYINSGYWNFPDNSPDIYDSNNPLEASHGTHVSGLIASVAGQTGADISILSEKVFWNKTAYTSDIIAAISYAKALGADIVNCSFGSTAENRALYEAIAGSEALFICAAGNNRRDVGILPSFPSCYDLPNIISVTSTNADGGLSYFSNYGPVCIAAQGRDMVSALPGGKTGVMSGTSMAAGYISGVAASVMSLTGSTDAIEIKNRLLDTADRLDNLTDKVEEGRRINLSNALSGSAGAYLSLNPADDFDANGYNPSESELMELYSGSKVIQVCAGANHSLALTESGDVFAWGDNYFGQCGIGYVGGTWEFGQVIGLDGILQIATGEDFSAALKYDGSVWIWGKSTDAGGIADSGVPMQAYELDYSDYITIRGDNIMGMFGGLPYEWEIGSGTVNYIYVADILMPVAGYTSMFVLGNDGTLYKNEGGASMWDPVFNDASLASAGADYTIISKSDQTVWLFNNQTNIAEAVQGITGVIFVEAGLDFSLAIKNNGTVWKITHSTKAVSLITGLSGIISASVSVQHVLALKSNGTIYGWGENPYGQLMNTLDPQVSPSQPGSVTFDITAGVQYTIALKGENIDSFISAVFILEYDPAKLELLDFAAQTGRNTTVSGFVQGTQLTILLHANGTVKFIANKAIPVGSTWGGVLTVLRFKALASGSTVVGIS